MVFSIDIRLELTSSIVEWNETGDAISAAWLVANLWYGSSYSGGDNGDRNHNSHNDIQDCMLGWLIELIEKEEDTKD